LAAFAALRRRRASDRRKFLEFYPFNSSVANQLGLLKDDLVIWIKGFLAKGDAA